MSVFVGDHICLSKIAGRPEFSPQLFKKGKIQVQFFIARAIKRSRCRTGVSARRGNLSCEKDQLRLAQTDTRLLGKYFFPSVFEAADDRARELTIRILSRRRIRGRI